MKHAIIPSLLTASLLLVAGCGDSKVKKTAREQVPKLFDNRNSVAEVICKNIRDFNAYEKGVWTGTAEIRLWVKVLIAKSEDGPVYVILKDEETTGYAHGENEPLDDGIKDAAMRLVPKVLQKWIPVADSTCTDIASVVFSGFEYNFELGRLKAWTGTAAVEMQLPVVIRRSGDSVEVKPDSAGIGPRKQAKRSETSTSDGGKKQKSGEDVAKKPKGSKKAVKLAEQGTEIATGIFQENMQREAQNDGTIWPGDSYTLYGKDGDVAKDVAGDTYSTSSAYFDDLIENDIVDGLDLGLFSSDGVPTPKKGGKLSSKAEFNAWSCVAVQGGSVGGDAPFLFTRNLKITDADIHAVLQDNKVTTSTASWAGKLDSKAKPLGKDCVVVITRAGAARIIDAKDLTPAAFFGDATFSSASDVRVLPAH